MSEFKYSPLYNCYVKVVHKFHDYDGNLIYRAENSDVFAHGYILFRAEELMDAESKTVLIMKEKKKLTSAFRSLIESIQIENEVDGICISDVEFNLTEFKGALQDFEDAL
jgi:hypothetical protein